MEYLIYEGPKFSIEWYYDERFKSQALTYYETLSMDEQDDFLVLVKALAEKGQIFNKEKFRNEGDKIFAFKPIFVFFYRR
ncbi:toxin-antitoxin system, toxin component [Leptospira santarosai serovar Guaricura]|nr:toxin-antitoxin system, toxin component [Leptospira santarosai serovar Guaricura]